MLLKLRTFVHPGGPEERSLFGLYTLAGERGREVGAKHGIFQFRAANIYFRGYLNTPPLLIVMLYSGFPCL